MVRRVAAGAAGDYGRPKTIPAPVKGWNTNESIANMDPLAAIFLDNFFPRTSDVMLRKGRQLLATLPVGEEVRTLVGYKSTAAAVREFAISQNAIWDITAPAAPVSVSPVTKADWTFENITTAGGSFILGCNGQDEMKLFDGTVWTDLNAVSTPAITGILTEEVTNISRFKSRIILCKKDSLSFYFLPVNSIGGAASEFPLGTVFTKGGYLVATATWTIDGGNGPDDYFIAVTSEGEIAVYVGTDPSSASTFNKVGTFQLPPPVGRRCFIQLDDDLLLMTQGAVFPLSKSLGRGNADPREAISNPISRAYAEATMQFKDLFGWQGTFFPDATMLLLNIPVLNYTSAGQNIVYSQQYVMNTTTKAWCRFVNWNAECFLAFDQKLRSALHNQVWDCWTGEADDEALIVGSAKQAFNPLSSWNNKHITMVRPMIQSGANITLQLGIDMDYQTNTLAVSSASYLQQLTLWNEAVWNQSRWNGTSAILSQWRSVNCRVGRMASVRLRVSAKNVSMSWISTDLILNDAGMV